jgi:hypothetical protein
MYYTWNELRSVLVELAQKPKELSGIFNKKQSYLKSDGIK